MTEILNELSKLVDLINQQGLIIDKRVNNLESYFADFDFEIEIDLYNITSWSKEIIKDFENFDEEKIKILKNIILKTNEIDNLYDEIIKRNNNFLTENNNLIKIKDSLEKTKSHIKSLNSKFKQFLKNVEMNLSKVEDQKKVNHIYDLFDKDQRVSWRYLHYQDGTKFEIHDKKTPAELAIRVPDNSDIFFVKVACEIIEIDFNKGTIKVQITLSLNLAKKLLILTWKVLLQIVVKIIMIW